MISSSSPTPSTASGITQKTEEQSVPTTSQGANGNIHKTTGLTTPKNTRMEAKPLDTYTIDKQDQLKELVTKKILCSLALDNLDSISGKIPGYGRFDPVRFLDVMFSLTEGYYRNTFPKTIIGIGSGQALLERCFDVMAGTNVKCYDCKPCNGFMPVEQAEFPRDIEKCLPDDCSRCLLVSAYPQEYSCPVIVEFIRRGGVMLCTIVEGNLYSGINAGYEKNSDVLIKGIKALREMEKGECFQVMLAENSMGRAPSYIQFYNWPSSDKQRMLDKETLQGLCSDIVCYDSDQH